MTALNRQDNMTDTKHKLMIKNPQKKHGFGTVSKNIFTEGLKQVLMYKP